jgi:hypothetical protein
LKDINDGKIPTNNQDEFKEKLGTLEGQIQRRRSPIFRVSDEALERNTQDEEGRLLNETPQ